MIFTLAWCTAQLIIIHNRTLWQHAYTRQLILAWGKSPWSRKSRNPRTRRSSSAVHQTHEVCQRLPSSYTLGFLMHRAHGALWILIRLEYQTWRVHANTNTLRLLQRETLLITLFLNRTRRNHRGGKKPLKTRPSDSSYEAAEEGKGKEANPLIFHLFMLHACWCSLCTCHILYFIITACRVAPTTNPTPPPTPPVHVMGTELHFKPSCRFLMKARHFYFSSQPLENKRSGVKRGLRFGAVPEQCALVLTRCYMNSIKTSSILWKCATALSLFLLQQIAAQKLVFQPSRRSSVTNRTCVFINNWFHNIASLCTDRRVYSLLFGLEIHPSIHPFLPSIHPSFHSSVYQSILLFIHSIYVHLSTYSDICPSVRPSF